MEITLDIYSIENISAFVSLELEQFSSQWEKWAEYVTSHRPDFIFTNHYLYCKENTTPLIVHSLFILLYYEYYHLSVCLYFWPLESVTNDR